MTTKELKTEFESKLENLKKRSRAWLIVLGVAVILAFVLLFTVFRKQPATDQSYKQEIERLQEKIEFLEQSNALRNSIISQHDKRLLENRKTETIIKHHYEQIPVNVTNLSREQLRSEVTNY